VARVAQIFIFGCPSIKKSHTRRVIEIMLGKSNVAATIDWKYIIQIKISNTIKQYHFDKCNDLHQREASDRTQVFCQ
jgi:hypothetical protein